MGSINITGSIVVLTLILAEYVEILKHKIIFLLLKTP